MWDRQATICNFANTEPVSLKPSGTVLLIDSSHCVAASLSQEIRPVTAPKATPANLHFRPFLHLTHREQAPPPLVQQRCCEAAFQTHKSFLLNPPQLTPTGFFFTFE